MDTEEIEEKKQHDPFFYPLTELAAKTRDEQFISNMGKVLRLSWLKYKTLEDIKAILALLLPSFACGCVENNDLVSLQEILVTMDVNAEDYDGNTAMHRACERGNVDIVKHLLSIGASCHLINRFGCTPLHLAIKNKAGKLSPTYFKAKKEKELHFDVIKFLNGEEATVNLKPVQVGVELIKAVLRKDCQLIHAWYLAGANMDQDDYNGQTALHAAVEKKDKHMVSKLLEYGATPEHRDVWGRTAADVARMKNLHDILVLVHPPYFL